MSDFPMINGRDIIQIDNTDAHINVDSKTPASPKLCTADYGMIAKKIKKSKMRRKKQFIESCNYISDDKIST